MRPNSLTSYARLPVLPALLCLHATVLCQGVLQCSQLRDFLCTFTCVACPPLSPATVLRLGVLQCSQTPGLPMHVYLCCLPTSVSTLRFSASESFSAAKLRDFLCRFTCVACPLLSPRYGALPGSPSVQPNSVTYYVGLPVLPALFCLHATVLCQGVLQCSQTP